MFTDCQRLVKDFITEFYCSEEKEKKMVCDSECFTLPDILLTLAESIEGDLSI